MKKTRSSGLEAVIASFAILIIMAIFIYAVLDEPRRTGEYTISVDAMFSKPYQTPSYEIRDGVVYFTDRDTGKKIALPKEQIQIIKEN